MDLRRHVQEVHVLAERNFERAAEMARMREHMERRREVMARRHQDEMRALIERRREAFAAVRERNDGNAGAQNEHQRFAPWNLLEDANGVFAQEGPREPVREVPRVVEGNDAEPARSEVQGIDQRIQRRQRRLATLRERHRLYAQQLQQQQQQQQQLNDNIFDVGDDLDADVDIHMFDDEDL
jgi:hypothetical protein